MKRFEVYDILEKLSDVTFAENLEHDQVDFLGKTPNGVRVLIRLRFSIAPSLQSLLSRRGNVEVTAQVWYNGISVLFTSNMDKDEMNLIGSYMSVKERNESDAQKANAYTELMKDINIKIK